MANNFDLDIRNYCIKDIEKLFGLQKNVKYTASDIELKQMKGLHTYTTYLLQE